jgi:hypothetical protein
MGHLCVNPVLPNWEYMPDVEPRVFGDRLYLYGSHDQFNGTDYCPKDYVGWSAPLSDLGDWRCSGITYRATQDPANPDGGQKLFAPDCVQGLDGRYYLYYCLHQTSRISVAVSGDPAGPFQFYGYVHQVDGTPFGGGHFAFDPGVMVEEDGSVWLYSGFAPDGEMRRGLEQAGLEVNGCYCMGLEGDMLTIKQEPTLVLPWKGLAEGTGFQGHAFYEASSPRKIGGRYYLVYSSQLSHELCYAVSHRPDGDFTYGGTIVSIGDLGWQGNRTAKNALGNTHGGLVEVDGQWYIFYHRQTNGTQFSRQVCAEPVKILPDGTIPQVEVTSCGLNKGSLPGRGTYYSSIACQLFCCGQGAAPYLTQTGEDREGEGDQYLAGIGDGGCCGFRYFWFQKTTGITLRLQGEGQGTLRVTQGMDGKPVAEIPVALTMQQGWQDCTGDFWGAEGVYPLYLTYSGSGTLSLASFRLF